MKEPQGIEVGFKPDTLESIGETDLIQLSRKLLDAVIVSSDALTPQDLTPERMKQMRLVNGMLNSSMGVIKTKLAYFRMVDTANKASAIKNAMKQVEAIDTTITSA